MNVVIDKAIALLRVGNGSWNISKIGKIHTICNSVVTLYSNFLN